MNLNIKKIKLFSSGSEKKSLKDVVFSGWKWVVLLSFVLLVIICAGSFYVFYKINSDSYWGSREMETVEYKPLSSSELKDTVRYYEDRVN